MHAREGREDQEDHSLERSERGAAEDLAEDDGGARYRSHHDGEQEAFFAVLDERHHGENRGEEDDHDESAGVEIIHVVLLALAGAGAERSAEAGADHYPEDQRRGQNANYARLLAVETDDLAPPQGEGRQQD